MKDLLLPTIIFYSSYLWGFYRNIPLTAVEPSLPFIDRAVGCAQLAADAYALEQAYHNVSISITEYTDTSVSGTTIIIPQWEIERNLTLSSCPSTANWTLNDPEAFLPYWPTNLTSAMSMPMPTPAAKQNPYFENIDLSILVVILAIVIKQYIDTLKWTGKMDAWISQPPEWIYQAIYKAAAPSIKETLQGFMQPFGQLLQRMDRNSDHINTQLSANSKDLKLLRQDLTTMRAAQVDAQVAMENVVHDAIRISVQETLLSSSFVDGLPEDIGRVIADILPGFVATAVADAMENLEMNLEMGTNTLSSGKGGDNRGVNEGTDDELDDEGDDNEVDSESTDDEGDDEGNQIGETY